MDWDEPEIVILDESGEPEPTPAWLGDGGQPGHTRSSRGRIGALLAIGALLLFGLGIVVGTHLDGQGAAAASPAAGAHDGLTGPGSVTAAGVPGDGASGTATGGVAPTSATSDHAARSITVGAPLAPTTAPEAEGSGGSSSGAVAEPSESGLPTLRRIEWAEPPLGDSTGWELIGYGRDPQGRYGDGVVVRFDPTGAVTTTPVPPMPVDMPVVLTVSAGNVLVFSPWNTGEGYRVPDGRPAQELPPRIKAANFLYPGADDEHFWLASSVGSDSALIEVTADGTETGATLQLPSAVPSGVGITVVGRSLLAYGVGGIYELSPDGARQVTHGMVIAGGPTGYLTWECDEKGACAAQLVHRATLDRRPIPGWTMDFSTGRISQGALSPDGSRAALWKFSNDGMVIQLLNLTDGGRTEYALQPADIMTDSTAQMLAFTPDGDYLFVATERGVVPIDVSNGTMLDPLPIPALSAITIRPVG